MVIFLSMLKRYSMKLRMCLDLALPCLINLTKNKTRYRPMLPENLLQQEHMQVPPQLY